MDMHSLALRNTGAHRCCLSRGLDPLAQSISDPNTPCLIVICHDIYITSLIVNKHAKNGQLKFASPFSLLQKAEEDTADRDHKIKTLRLME